VVSAADPNHWQWFVDEAGGGGSWTKTILAVGPVTATFDRGDSGAHG
jgi:hypothetical protein